MATDGVKEKWDKYYAAKNRLDICVATKQNVLLKAMLDTKSYFTAFDTGSPEDVRFKRLIQILEREYQKNKEYIEFLKKIRQSDSVGSLLSGALPYLKEWVKAVKIPGLKTVFLGIIKMLGYLSRLAPVYNAALTIASNVMGFYNNRHWFFKRILQALFYNFLKALIFDLGSVMSWFGAGIPVTAIGAAVNVSSALATSAQVGATTVAESLSAQNTSRVAQLVGAGALATADMALFMHASFRTVSNATEVFREKFNEGKDAVVDALKDVLNKSLKAKDEIIRLLFKFTTSLTSIVGALLDMNFALVQEIVFGLYADARTAAVQGASEVAENIKGFANIIGNYLSRAWTSTARLNTTNEVSDDPNSAAESSNSNARDSTSSNSNTTSLLTEGPRFELPFSDKDYFYDLSDDSENTSPWQSIYTWEVTAETLEQTIRDTSLSAEDVVEQVIHPETLDTAETGDDHFFDSIALGIAAILFQAFAMPSMSTFSINEKALNYTHYTPHPIGPTISTRLRRPRRYIDYGADYAAAARLTLQL